MEPKIASGCEDFVYGAGDARPTLDKGADEFERFVQAAPLAGELGRNGWQRLDHLRAQTADFDQHVRDVYAARAAAAVQKTASGWEQPIAEDSHRLAKRYIGDPLHKGENTATTKLSPNGLWRFEYDAAGNLLRGYAIE